MNKYITIDDLVELKQRQYWRVGSQRLPELMKMRNSLGGYIVGLNMYNDLTLMGDNIIVVDGNVIEYVSGETVRTLNK